MKMLDIVHSFLKVILLFAFISNQFDSYGFQDQTGEIFFDDFDDNRNNWPWLKDAEKYSGKIENGALQWSSKIKESYSIFLPLEIEEGKDLVIESSIKCANPNGIASILFGKSKDGWQRIECKIFQGGQYKITHRPSEKTLNIVSWQESKAVIPDHFNRITIYRIDGKHYFLLNGKLIHTGHLSWYGNSVGFTAGHNSDVWVDYLKVSYLNETPLELRNELQSRRGVILSEPFDDNRNNWPLRSKKTYSVSISDGNYSIINDDNGPKHFLKRFEVDATQNFKIGFDIKHVSGVADKSISLKYGFDSKSNEGYLFGITGNGYWRIMRLGSRPRDLVDFTQSELVLQNEFNHLEVEKIGERAFFYINDKMVATGKFMPMPGLDFGIDLPNNCNVQADNFLITYLPDEETLPQVPNSAIDIDKLLEASIDDPEHQKYLSSLQKEWDYNPKKSEENLEKVMLEFGKPVKYEKGHLWYNYKKVGGRQYYIRFDGGFKGYKGNDETKIYNYRVQQVSLTDCLFINWVNCG